VATSTPTQASATQAPTQAVGATSPTPQPPATGIGSGGGDAGWPLAGSLVALFVLVAGAGAVFAASRRS
jgi:hypothetical protein